MLLGTSKATDLQVKSDMDLPPHFLRPQVHLSRARGYFELEMFEDAKKELRALPDQMPWSKFGCELLVTIHQAQKSWEEMMMIANQLRRDFPEEAQWWIMSAYATRRHISVADAEKILQEGMLMHTREPMIKYNLACYACLLHRFDDCMNLLKESVAIDEKYKLLALEDEDLREIREKLLELGWGRVVV